MAYNRAMAIAKSIILDLDRRRRDLGMTRSTLARRAGLGLRTVQRILSDEAAAANLATVVRLAEALGASIGLELEELNTVRRHQAERKAARLVDMVQGTMGLEAQAVGGDSIEQMKKRTVRDLLAGSNSALWND